MQAYQLAQRFLQVAAIFFDIPIGAGRAKELKPIDLSI